MTSSRRSFLRRAAVLPLGALPVTALAAHDSDAVAEALAPRAPSWANEVGQTKVAKVETYAVRRLNVVKVTADDGTVGWGEAGHSGGRLVLDVVRREITELVEGTDVFDAEPTWAKVFYEIDELGPGGLASQALAGVDCALWDLRGKLLGVPVSALLGGTFRTSFPVYGSFSRSLGGDRRMTPEQAADKAVELVEEGFRALKVRMAIREEGADPIPDPSWPVLDAVRAAIGDDIALYVDANNGYTPGRAILAARRLREDYGAEVFEEPVAAYHYPSLGRVSDATDLLIACGEHEYTLWQFRDLILQGRVDLLNPDVSKLGGLTEAKKVAALAEAFDLPISVHNARPTLLTAAHAHFVASCRTAYRTQEHPGNERLQSLWQYFENRLTHDNGVFHVPTGPGLGLVVNEDALKRDAD
ncbi:MAG: mandelate racemase/muconate lactonizing enzyme family protein [Bacteroidota bacterium]